MIHIIIELWKKGEWYVAKSPELDSISQVKTPEEARKNLKRGIGFSLQGIQ